MTEGAVPECEQLGAQDLDMTHGDHQNEDWDMTNAVHQNRTPEAKEPSVDLRGRSQQWIGWEFDCESHTFQIVKHISRATR